MTKRATHRRSGDEELGDHMALTTGNAVPVIDCSSFTGRGDDDGRLATAQAIDLACQEYGFLVISGHGVPADTIESMRDVSARFFALPLDEKLKVVACKAANAYRGYLSPESKSHSADLDAPPDLMEKFIVSRFETHEDALAAGYRPGLEEWFAPNVWPLEPPDMKAIWQRYFTDVSRLAQQLMGAFAVALDLPDGWFEDKIDEHFSSLTANHYPPQLRSPAPGQLRIAPHTDTGSLTLIPQDGAQAGLEIQHPASGE